MKRLTLHRIASSLYRFIASIAQLWYHVYSETDLAPRDAKFDMFWTSTVQAGGEEEGGHPRRLSRNISFLAAVMRTAIWLA